MKKVVFVIFSLFLVVESNAQIKKYIRSKDSTDITFTGTKLNPYAQEFDTSGKVIFSAYFDSYFSAYSDSVNGNGFVKFPTIAPRSKQFGLNIIQVSAKYISPNFRGTATIFGGDCPLSAWSPILNFVQEANAGFRVVKNVWIDAGFFRTHFGLESIQPRENMTMSLATTTYFEPYFLSGAKLTWQLNSHFALQANIFNSFNQFTETNRNKALGMSFAYTNGDKFSLTYSNIFCDESAPISGQWRQYHNLISVFKTTHHVLGCEVNFGGQKGTAISSNYAMMFSSLLAYKYRITPQIAVYGRGEFFSDPKEILTGPVYNDNHTLVGLNVYGGTFGAEYKPIPNSYFRIEGRLLSEYRDKIFYVSGNPSNQRYELIVGLGLWF